jgi:hypothetical protein
MTADSSEASVVNLYQSAGENARLRPKLVSQLPEGIKVISNEFGIPGWRPTEFHVFKEGHHNQRVLVYIIGSHTPM